MTETEQRRRAFPGKCLSLRGFDMESSAGPEQGRPRQLIAEGWADYVSMYVSIAFPKGPSARQYRELRRAFYAGVGRLALSVGAELAVSANREEAAIAMAESVDAELENFTELVVRGDA